MFDSRRIASEPWHSRSYLSAHRGVSVHGNPSLCVPLIIRSVADYRHECRIRSRFVHDKDQRESRTTEQTDLIDPLADLWAEWIWPSEWMEWAKKRGIPSKIANALPRHCKSIVRPFHRRLHRRFPMDDLSTAESDGLYSDGLSENDVMESSEDRSSSVPCCIATRICWFRFLPWLCCLSACCRCCCKICFPACGKGDSPLFTRTRERLARYLIHCNNLFAHDMGIRFVLGSHPHPSSAERQLYLHEMRNPLWIEIHSLTTGDGEYSSLPSTQTKTMDGLYIDDFHAALGDVGLARLHAFPPEELSIRRVRLRNGTLHAVHWFSPNQYPELWDSQPRKGLPHNQSIRTRQGITSSTDTKGTPHIQGNPHANTPQHRDGRVTDGGTSQTSYSSHTSPKVQRDVSPMASDSSSRSSCSSSASPRSSPPHSPPTRSAQNLEASPARDIEPGSHGQISSPPRHSRRKQRAKPPTEHEAETSRQHLEHEGTTSMEQVEDRFNTDHAPMAKSDPANTAVDPHARPDSSSRVSLSVSQRDVRFLGDASQFHDGPLADRLQYQSLHADNGVRTGPNHGFNTTLDHHRDGSDSESTNYSDDGSESDSETWADWNSSIGTLTTTEARTLARRSFTSRVTVQTRWN